MLPESIVLKQILRNLHGGGRLTLFLDYDGTLVPIAPTPDEALPDKALLDLLAKLVQTPRTETIILSGRPLEALLGMFPIRGLTLAGIYGLQVQRDDQVVVRAESADEVRPVLAQVKKEWGRLIEKRQGFLLEDKGYALALHARFAEANEAETVLKSARKIVADIVSLDRFRILDGFRFLEIAPVAADKARAVERLLAGQSASNILSVYFGDDDKDEEAFPAIHRAGGVCIGVGERYPLALADDHLASSDVVREWLREIVLNAV